MLIVVRLFTIEISKDEFHFEPNESGNNAERELDESKEFFELVQQFMAEYTASAKVSLVKHSALLTKINCKYEHM